MRDESGSAALEWHKNVVELLLCRGVSVDGQRESGETALHSAALFGHKDVVELLLN